MGNPNFTRLSQRRNTIVAENKYGKLGGYLMFLRRSIKDDHSDTFHVTQAVLHFKSKGAADRSRDLMDKNLAEFNAAIDNPENQKRFIAYCTLKAKALGETPKQRSATWTEQAKSKKVKTKASPVTFKSGPAFVFLVPSKF